MTACSAAPPAVQHLLQVVVAAGEEVGGAGGEGCVLEHGGGLHPQPGPAHRGLERLPVLQPQVNINIEVKDTINFNTIIIFYIPCRFLRSLLPTWDLFGLLYKAN